MSATSVAEAPQQSDLSLLESQGWEAHVLEQIPWRRPTDAHGEPIGHYPGLAEIAPVRHLAATALLNDFFNFGIMADVRLDAAALAELLADPHRPTRNLKLVYPDGQGPLDGVPAVGIQVQGPGPTEARANNARAAGYRPGTHWWTFRADRWAEVPAFVAHWFWWQQKEDARLGAAYRRSLAPEEREPDQGRDATTGVASVTTRMALRYEAGESDTPPAELFTFRMACEREQGYRPSGLIDPTAHAAREAEIADLRAQLAALTKPQKPPKGQEG
jgi:hypothetical protein